MFGNIFAARCKNRFPFIRVLPMVMIIVVAFVHSRYITVTMTGTAIVEVQSTLTYTTTKTTAASSSAKPCNSSTAAQPIKLSALTLCPCVLQHHHSRQKHSTSQQLRKCSQPQHILSSSHVRPFQQQQSPPQLADGTKAAQPAPATTPELSPNEFNARDWLSSKVLIHKQSIAQSSNDSDERPSGTLSSLGNDNPSGKQ